MRRSDEYPGDMGLSATLDAPPIKTAELFEKPWKSHRHGDDSLNSAMRIGIVGGGPGGLMTAYLLRKYLNHPVHITILEASSRLGGKIETHRFANSAAMYEGGAAELYDYSHIDEDPLKELVQELGLPILRMEGSAVICHEKLVAHLDDFQKQFGCQATEAMLKFDRRAADMQSPWEFYYSDNSVPSDSKQWQSFQALLGAVQEPATEYFLGNMIHSDLATETTQTSLDYGLQNYLMNNPRYMQLYSIDGGNERIIEELIARTPAEHLLQHKVTAIRRLANGTLQVDAVVDGLTQQHDFDFVVVALPNLALPKVNYEGDRFATAMDRHIQHYHHPAHYLRITILFDKPFWRKSFPDSFCMLDRFGGCCLYDESLRHPGFPHGILGWLIAGDAAVSLANQDDDSLIQEALNSLPDFLAAGKEQYIEGRIHRWIGAVNAIPGGKSAVSLDRRHQPEPIDHPNLFVVGDYLFDSTLNGVLDSADYVSQWIVSKIQQKTG